MPIELSKPRVVALEERGRKYTLTFANFITGSGAHGSYFEMPDGFSTADMLCWASPQGVINSGQQLESIQDCDAYATRLLSLIYQNPGATWNGPLNYSAICWRTAVSATTFTVGLMNYVELTLLGGEEVIFGKGYLLDGLQVALPAGYSDTRSICLAMPKTAAMFDHNAHGFAAWVEPTGISHDRFQDGEANIWGGTHQTFVFGYKNNMGTWLRDANGWAHCPLPNGQSFGVGGFSLYAQLPTLYPSTDLTQVPSGGDDITPIMPMMEGMSEESLQIMPTEGGFTITGNTCHGVQQCYIDADLGGHCVFTDGEDNHWSGSVAAFALLCDTPTGAVGSTPAPAAGTGTTWPGTGYTGGSGGSGGSGGGSGGSGGSGGGSGGSGGGGGDGGSSTE